MPLPGNEPLPGAPIPAGSIPWPPPAIAGALPKLQEWAAWWGNDPDALAGQYRADGPAARNRPSQYRGGLQGAFARMFWGTPTPAGQTRAKLHLPIASDIATASADLLYAEEVKFTPEQGTPKAAVDRLEELLDAVSWSSFLVEQAEPASPLGGVYHRIVWDASLAPHPIVSVVHADLAWPEFQWGRLRAVTFWTDVHRRDNVVYRILERHETGQIEWGAYEGTQDKLGRRIPLPELARFGVPIPDVDEQSGISTGIPQLTAVYVPNIKPVRSAWRVDPNLSNLGRSDLDGIEPLLDAADETMTSWMRDLRLGAGRIIVPEWMLTPSTAEGRGSLFNINQEAFVGLNAAVNADEGLGQQLTVQQFALRTREHAETLSGVLAAAFRGAGYSQQTFGIAGEGEGMTTATEVNARESRSARTREKKTRYQVDALALTLDALLAVDREHFGGAWPVGVKAPRAAFPDVTRADPQTEAQTLSVLRAAEAVSIYTVVKRAQPDLDETAVALEVQRILDEQAAKTPIVPDLGALPSDPEQDQPADGQGAPGADQP